MKQKQKQKPDTIKSKNVENFSLEPVFPKMVFLVENRKNEYHHLIQHVRIYLCTKFSLKR